MKVGLIDLDGKLPNLALMKLSTYYKSRGCEVALNDFSADLLYCSVIFNKSRAKAETLKHQYPHMIIGGNAWDKKLKLSPEIHYCKPDYDLYTPEIIYQRIRGGIGKKDSKAKKADIIANAGIGFTSRGCVRNCGFCEVPEAEGPFRQENEIADLLNPRSNVLILLDNNLTVDPYCLEKLREIRERGLVVDITQGIDVRLLTPEIAMALSEVKHLRSIHYAWDLMSFERPVLEGIKILSQHVKTYKHLCFMLTGFNTTFEEDMYRFRRILGMKVDPYVMVYNNQGTEKTRHFARWVNGRIYKVSSFEDYWPWVKARSQGELFT
ncbi:MAG: radical SAM protein [Thermincolia bacterium]